MRVDVGSTQGHNTALVVEDDTSVSSMLRRHLSRAGFVVYEARGEREAVRRAEEISPDIVLLDLMLEDGSGADVCRRLREGSGMSDVPVLVLTARDEVNTKVALFALGADDYVVKPVDPSEVLSRVQALMRRGSERRMTRRIGRLRVALSTGDAWIDERQLDLTSAERAIVVQLARDYPALTPRAVLDRRPWRDAEASSNVTEVLIGRLRRKIAGAGGGVEIRVVRRAGYGLRPMTAEKEVGA
jgi:two-component system response regulator MprA